MQAVLEAYRLGVLGYTRLTGYPQMIWMTFFWSEDAGKFIFVTSAQTGKVAALEANNRVTINFGDMLTYEGLQYIHAAAARLDLVEQAVIMDELWDTNGELLERFFDGPGDPELVAYRVDIREVCIFDQYVERCFALTNEH